MLIKIIRKQRRARVRGRNSRQRGEVRTIVPDPRAQDSYVETYTEDKDKTESRPAIRLYGLRRRLTAIIYNQNPLRRRRDGDVINLNILL